MAKWISSYLKHILLHEYYSKIIVDVKIISANWK